MSSGDSSTPVLWHIRISHYSEKARWALDHKRVPHRRRAPVPGSHLPIALWLTRGQQATFPVLEIEGEAIGDSTAIIAALEERHPDRPLYPVDPDQLRRALELEDFFDEELGPKIRLLAWHEVTREPEGLIELVGPDVPDSLLRLDPGGRATVGYAKAFTQLRYGVKSDDAAADARASVIRALDRLEAELDGNDYLVGDGFTVADLAAAALFYPLVNPLEGPALPAGPEPLERFRATLADRRGYRWVEETFHRHRRRAQA
jgi:glutathione S-transferase